MSVRVPLFFQTRLSKDGIPSIRMFVKVSFKSTDHYIAPAKAIIDTGAPVSMVPFNIWGQCVVPTGKHLLIPSITDRPECDIGVTQDHITMALLDDEGHHLIEDWTIPVDLCDTSEMPLILGMHGFLSEAHLVMNYWTGEAWLEFPDSFFDDAES